MGRIMGDLDELIAATRAVAERRRAKDVQRGQLEGLLETGPARVAARPGESVLHHAGYLTGHLIRWLHEHGKPLETPMMLTAAVYGASMADERGQRALAKSDNAVTAHILAAIRAEEKTGLALDAADERMLFGWLLEQTNSPATPQLIAKLDRLRARRLERTGFGPDSPTDVRTPDRS